MAAAQIRTRSDVRREVQLAALIDAAEARIARDGLPALKARDLAGDIGVAVGGLYNLVPDMEALLLHVSARVLARLDAAIEAQAVPMPTVKRKEAVERLVVVALTYLRFAKANPFLWRMIFDLRITAPLPAWHAQDQQRLLRHISDPLSRIAQDLYAPALATRSRTLFAAVHGLVSIGLEDRLVAVPPQHLEDEIAWLVRAACAKG